MRGNLLGEIKLFYVFFQRSYHARIFAPRRSTPSSSNPSASGFSRSFSRFASALFGQLNVPCSSRFVDTQQPVPSKHSTFTGCAADY